MSDLQAADQHALTGAYAVDALDDLERTRFEQHLAGCQDCRTEADELRQAAALLAEVVAVVPPAALRDRVLAAADTVRPLPPVRVTAQGARPSRRAWLGLATAAAVVAIIGVGAAVLEPWRDDGTVQTPTATERVLQAPDAATETLTFPGGASAELVRSEAQHRAVLITRAMPPAPDGKVYQVWFDMPGRGMVSAAVMPPKADQTVLLEGDAAVATGAGITVEPTGGSAEPTSEPIALFAFTDLEPS